jgi:formamidopyrimidine-DNA glycosylase
MRRDDMPELPDVSAYVDLLSRRIVGGTLHRVRVRSPFLVRTFEPPIEQSEGRRVVGVSRLGKRIVLELNGDQFLVLHLMIAGRLLWKPPKTAPSGKIDLAAFWFEGGTVHAPDGGTLLLTEAGTKKRASLHVIQGRDRLADHSPAGLDVLSTTFDRFLEALSASDRTIKRALTDPRTFDGIGNAYSDEILHAAGMSPYKRAGSMHQEDARRLFDAARRTLTRWIDELRHEFELDRDGPGRFPKVGEITAFRPGFAVHGRFGQPCPICGTAVQRIVRAENEINYCPRCQTEGRMLADRSLSKLFKDDRPETIEEWEDGRR